MKLYKPKNLLILFLYNHRIKKLIQYYKNEHRLSLKFAKECAEEDLKIYIEKYGEKSLTSR